MFGCDSRPTMRASASMTSASCARAFSATRSSRRVLTATRRSRWVSCARYTVPWAPRPSVLTISNRPMRAASNTAAIVLLLEMRGEHIRPAARDACGRTADACVYAPRLRRARPADCRCFPNAGSLGRCRDSLKHEKDHASLPVHGFARGQPSQVSKARRHTRARVPAWSKMLRCNSTACSSPPPLLPCKPHTTGQPS